MNKSETKQPSPVDDHCQLPYDSNKICDFSLISEIICWSLVPQTVKNQFAMQETSVQSLVQEGPLEKGVATHFSVPAWRIPWTEKPGGLQSMGSQRVGHDWATNTFTFIAKHNRNLKSTLFLRWWLKSQEDFKLERECVLHLWYNFKS